MGTLNKALKNGFSELLRNDQVAYLVSRLGYGLDDPGFESWQGQAIVIFSQVVKTASEGSTQPPVQWVTVYFPGHKAAVASCRSLSFI